MGQKETTPNTRDRVCLGTNETVYLCLRVKLMLVDLERKIPLTQ